MRRASSSALALCMLLPAAVASQDAVESGTRPPRETGDIQVVIRGFEHDDGKALVGLYRSADGFPDEGERAFRRWQVRIRDGRAVVVFRDVPPGPFAVAVMHDEDGDYEMDTGLFGIPTEGYGVSRDGTRPFGPPEFEDCVMTLRAGDRRRVRISMHY